MNTEKENYNKGFTKVCNSFIDECFNKFSNSCSILYIYIKRHNYKGPFKTSFNRLKKSVNIKDNRTLRRHLDCLVKAGFISYKSKGKTFHHNLTITVLPNPLFNDDNMVMITKASGNDSHSDVVMDATTYSNDSHNSMVMITNNKDKDNKTTHKIEKCVCSACAVSGKLRLQIETQTIHMFMDKYNKTEKDMYWTISYLNHEYKGKEINNPAGLLKRFCESSVPSSFKAAAKKKESDYLAREIAARKKRKFEEEENNEYNKRLIKAKEEWNKMSPGFQEGLMNKLIDDSPVKSLLNGITVDNCFDSIALQSLLINEILPNE